MLRLLSGNCAQLTYDASTDPRDGVQFERLLVRMLPEMKE